MIDMPSHISKVIKTHKGVRYFDTTTPYWVHPLWCAMTILTETNLSKDLRVRGSLVLLYHDLLEEESSVSIKDIPKSIRDVCIRMNKNFEEERKTIDEESVEIKLYTLYDKVSNLLDSSWMNPKKRRVYEEYVKKLVGEVKKHYPNLNITKIAEVIIKK